MKDVVRRVSRLLPVLGLLVVASAAPAKAADTKECVRELAKAVSDCVKGTNKECKAGIDRAIDKCTK